jgi:hypothetical protein
MRESQRQKGAKLVADQSRRFGRGQRVSLKLLLQLARSRSVAADDRAWAWELMGHVMQEHRNYDRAHDAYICAVRLFPKLGNEVKMYEAEAIAFGGLDKSMAILNSVDRRVLRKYQRILYWSSALDLVALTWDVQAIRRVMKRVPSTYRIAPEISGGLVWLRGFLAFHRRQKALLAGKTRQWGGGLKSARRPQGAQKGGQAMLAGRHVSREHGGEAVSQAAVAREWGKPVDVHAEPGRGHFSFHAGGRPRRILRVR